MADHSETERLREWLAEVAAVRLLRRGWSITRTARATGVNRDIVRHYRRVVADGLGKRRPATELVGPPPRVVDRKVMALKGGHYGTLYGVD